jgi:hypothetical protein
MTSAPARLYVAALAVLLFFVLWAALAARPWTAAAPADARLAALTRREAALRVEAAAVQARLDRQWSAYRAELRRRNAAPAPTAQPQVSITALPAVTTTRSS